MEIMEKLPPEIMTHILALLPFKVRRNMAMMNKTWYYASLHPILLHEEFLVYNEPNNNQQNISEECLYKFQNTLMKTERTLLKLKFQKPTFDHMKFLTIFEISKDRLIALHLDQLSSFTVEHLYALAKYCKNLEKLELCNIKQFSLVDKSYVAMPKLRSITFNTVSNMYDREFNFIIQCAPNLEHLRFVGCDILSWPQVIRRYYPDFRNSEKLTNFNSDFVFTDINIINYFKTAQNIKSLKLHNDYHIFYQLPKHIKLNSLLVNLVLNIKANYVDNDIFKLKLGEHTSLKKLVITGIPCCYLSAVSKLYNLNYLSITYTTNVMSNCRDKSACLQQFCDSLENMKNMKKLCITQYHTSNAYLLPPKIPDCLLNSLKLLDCSIENPFRVLNLVQNLDSLLIQNGQILQSSDFLLLFNKLIHLRCLSVNDCVELTDAILLSSPVSNIKGLNTLNLINTRLTHRSLRQFKLLHLKNLTITSLSLGSCIETRNTLDFEDSMKQLSYSAPVLSSLRLYILNNEVRLLKHDENLLNSLSKSNEYKYYFKNLQKFELHLY